MHNENNSNVKEDNSITVGKDMFGHYMPHFSNTTVGYRANVGPIWEIDNLFWFSSLLKSFLPKPVFTDWSIG